jgi:tetratricopeptide (TPR) repeat protein
MFEFDHFDDDIDDDVSDAFVRWDGEVADNIPHGYFDPDELCDIIDTYLSIDRVEESLKTLMYAIKVHRDNEDMIYDIMLILNEYERWNDLLDLTNGYRSLDQYCTEGQRIAALLHLGMEEDAFICFGQAKKRYANDEEMLVVLYLTMAETLNDVDLYEASIRVVYEILPQIEVEDNDDFLWVLLQSYFSLDDKENVLKLCDQILAINPMDADTWSRLGMAYKDIDEKEKAIEAFEFAISLGKNDLVDQINLIYSYKENGNILKALEKTDEYLQEIPDDYVINLLAANMSMEIEAWERALEYTENILKINSSLDFLYLYKSKCLFHLGEIRKAIKTLEKGLSKSDDEVGEIKKKLEELKRDYPEYL